MSIHYTGHGATIHAGDCLDILATLPDASVDAVVTDPPYDLTAGKKGGTGTASIDLTTPYGRARISAGNGGGGFMGMAWDSTGIAFDPAVWIECLRVLKPGGHLLAFGGTRTWHRLACAIEDAGFEVRDSIAWMYGSGFPKSLDVSKAIDKAAGATRTERTGVKPGHEKFVGRDNVASLRESGALSGEGGYSRPWMFDPEQVEASHHTMAPATPDAAAWAGWGTALKPAFEPIFVARKPLTGTVAANVLAHGTGALNIDACRIGTEERTYEARGMKNLVDQHAVNDRPYVAGLPNREQPEVTVSGRWPANVVLDDHAAAALDAQSGESVSRIGNPRGADHGDGWGMTATGAEYADTGGASRFYYTAKADATERPNVAGVRHPTVKPLDLMRWLVRLVTPPGGVVLEPFAGSGTTVEACLLEGFQCIAIEREADYLPLIVARITRQRDPVAHVRLVGDDELTLFDEPA